jgi:tRNA splicing endonuclease
VSECSCVASITDDPSTHHSSYIVFVNDLEDENPALDMIALARLGTNVGKTIVQASVDPTDKDRKPDFISYVWHQTMSNPPRETPLINS